MTPKQLVKSVYPRAYSYHRRPFEIKGTWWEVWTDEEKLSEYLSEGATSQKAWKNAWDEIKYRMLMKLSQ